MTDELDILNQTEAADYISAHGIDMSGPKLSNLTQNGGGPRFTKKGNQKLFLKPHVDSWIQERKRDR